MRILLNRTNLLVCFIILFLISFYLISRPAVSYKISHEQKATKFETILVRNGDTLSSIAEHYVSDNNPHTTSGEYMEQIIRLNNLESEYIRAGQYLLLPEYDC